MEESIMKEEFMKIMNFRHACKLFDEKKEVSDDSLRFILEVGRLSPSSFGLEQWQFIVTRSKELKERLREACFGQVQLTSCSVVVVIAAKIADLKPDSAYVKETFGRNGFTPEVLSSVSNFYSSFHDNIDVREWSITQCHIAAANMMTAAASTGIDSCPIGAYDSEIVKRILSMDGDSLDIALIIPFGYRKNPQPQKKRRSFDEIVRFI